MKQKDRSLLCLLTFTMLLFSFSSIFAAVSVTYESKALPYNQTGTITATVVTDVDIVAFDLVTKVTSTVTNAFGKVTNLTVAPAIPGAVFDFTTRVDGNTDDFTHVYGYDPNPFNPPILPASGSPYVFTFTVNTNCHIGDFTLGDGEWVVDPDGLTYVTTLFVNASAEAEPLTLTPGTITLTNATPVITNCLSDQTLDACAALSHTFIATDDDVPCNPPVWSLVDPVPDGATIAPSTGAFVYNPPTDPLSLGPQVIMVRVTDEQGATADCQFTVTVHNEAPAITTCPGPSTLDACLVYNFAFEATDENICVALAWSLIDAPDGAIIDPVTGAFTYNPPTLPASLGDKLMKVQVADEFGAVANCEFTITVFNTTPVFDNCPTEVVNLTGCTTLIREFPVTDPNKCIALVYSLVAPVPSGAIINPATGTLTYDPPDVTEDGLVPITVRVTDEFGAYADCSFEVHVIVVPPMFTQCPTAASTVWNVWGTTLSGAVVATDGDALPLPLDYTLVSFSGPITAGAFFVDHVTGAWNWPTEFGNNAYLGAFTAVVQVTDGCRTATCTFDVYVTRELNFAGEIHKLHDVIQGHYAFVPVDIFAGNIPIGGFDLLIGYDASALTLSEVLPGPQISDPTLWEYFTYRFGGNGNCNGPCPSGLVRIVAIADMNNGFAHPVDAAYYVNGTVAILKFLVTNDRTYECQFVPLGFYWIDCTDNVVSSKNGQQAYISDEVWYYTGDNYPLEELIRIDTVTGASATFWGGYAGWGGILGDPNCLAGSGFPNKPLPIEYIDFYDGGIDIACADSIDLRGDLNLNGIANEIGDAVIYTQYFLIGIDAFPLNGRQGAIAASDVNADGTPLSIGDLVYLLRIIVGDAYPYTKLGPYSSDANIRVSGDRISTESSEAIGALYLTFDVTGDNFSVVNHTNMEVMSNRVGDKLNVLVYSGLTNLSNAIPAGTNELLTVTGAQLNSVQASDYYGSLLNTRVAKTALPTQFSLSQNIPNPFNPSTKIGLDLPNLTGWQIDIYNVNGQLVQSYNGTNIGHVEVTWDATSAASGIYFYKVTAGSFTDTKKMVLMK